MITDDPKQTKQCRKCGQDRTINYYYPCERGLFGVTGTCRLCKSDYNQDRAAKRADQRKEWLTTKSRYEFYRKLQRDYGLTQQDYVNMLTACASGCMICGTHMADARICVDHDHNTGQVRGLLCYKCNAAIGMLRDSPTIIRQALTYLETPL